jgi:hypothetical protein
MPKCEKCGAEYAEGTEHQCAASETQAAEQTAGSQPEQTSGESPAEEQSEEKQA